MKSVQVADCVYARIRDLLEVQPEVFTVTRDGLELSIDNIDEHVLMIGTAGAIPRSTACHAAFRDRYLLRANSRVWVMLPAAFDIDDDSLPARMIDSRRDCADDAMTAW